MYQIRVQLYECNELGDIVDYRPIHEIRNIAVNTIQEAFESLESGKEMFETYLEIDKEIKDDINRILQNDK